MTTMTPVLRQSLSDDLAQRIRQLIQARNYRTGDRLPSISAMAREFAVGAPTLREALKKLQTVGIVHIRHGSGVYVGREPDSLVISNPVFDGNISKKLLADLIVARKAIETTSARLAAMHASEADLAELERLLAEAGANLGNAAILNQTNLAFHRQIAVASDNTVIRQMLEVLTSVFRQEQLVILDIRGSRAEDHQEHVRILEVLRARDPEASAARMHEHLEGVRQRLLAWDPATEPIA